MEVEVLITIVAFSFLGSLTKELSDFVNKDDPISFIKIIIGGITGFVANLVFIFVLDKHKDAFIINIIVSFVGGSWGNYLYILATKEKNISLILKKLIKELNTLLDKKEE